MEAKKYIKKPVVIEAMELTIDSMESVANFVGESFKGYHYSNEKSYSRGEYPIGLFIQTLEGTRLANIGDMVIKGVKGEFYPCKPDIFAMTYESAEKETVSESESVNAEAAMISTIAGLQDAVHSVLGVNKKIVKVQFSSLSGNIFSEEMDPLGTRYVRFSFDGGKTWGEKQSIERLIKSLF
jgi:hypothetical protein